MSANHDRIEGLISRTTDPVQQATLLVLARIDGALDENTRATQRIATAFEGHKNDFQDHMAQFDKHVVDEARIISAAKGAWWASTLLIAAVISLGGWIVKGYTEAVHTQSVYVQDLVKRVTVLETINAREHTPPNGNGK